MIGLIIHLIVILGHYETWSSQDAVAYTFPKYLSKRETLRKWSVGPDTRLNTRDRSFALNHCRRLIKYACLDCLSSTDSVYY